MFNKFKNLPSIVYVILIPIALIVFIGGIILLFTSLATVEGVGSIIMLIAGLIVVLVGNTTTVTKVKPAAGAGFGLAIGIVFFGLMGMSIDQPGNFIYNKPLEIFYCPTGTTLNREAVVTNPLPGRTDINQDFTCFDAKGKIIATIDILSIMLVRFVEYIILGYILVGIGKIVNLLKLKKELPSNGDHLISE